MDNIPTRRIPIRRAAPDRLLGDEDLLDGADLSCFYDDDPPAPALGLDTAQLAELAAAVRSGLARDGCDNTLRAARGWARGAGMNWPRLRSRLEGNGGYCDCEILFNVAPDGPD